MAEQIIGTPIDVDEPRSTASKIFRFFAWSSFALACLVVFTLLKIPQAKIHNTIVGHLNQQLAPSGIQLSADSGRIGIGLGLTYSMSGVKLVTPNNKVLKISEIEITPSVLAVAQGKFGGAFSLREGQGSVEGAFFTTKAGDIEADIHSPGINLGFMGVLPFLAGIEGTAEVKGDVQIAGNPKSVSSLTGAIKLNLSKMTIDQQSYKGFNLPRIAISDGVFDVTLGAGKATINSLRLGKQGGTDDLFYTASGDVKLGRTIDGSELNLRMKLGLAPGVQRAFPLIDTLLAAAKTPDGTYALKVNGPMMGAMPMPDK